MRHPYVAPFALLAVLSAALAACASTVVSSSHGASSTGAGGATSESAGGTGGSPCVGPRDGCVIQCDWDVVTPANCVDGNWSCSHVGFPLSQFDTECTCNGPQLNACD